MNLMEILQALQQAQKAPSMAGPIAPQNPAPGFRAPALNYAPAPQLPAPQQIDPEQISKTVGGLAGALQRLANQPPPAPGQEPNRTASDRDLNGYGGSAENPFGNPNAVPTVYNLGGGIGSPPDGSSGIGTSPYGAYQPGFAESLLRRLGLYNLF